MAGYSKTPLWKKLGYKPGMEARLLDAPSNYAALVAPLPHGVHFIDGASSGPELIHAFFKRRADLQQQLPELMATMAVDGAIWVSWPKKSSKVESDMSEDVVRAVALPLGLVDIKVCAVDDVWSALKLVIRRENRPR